MGENLSFKKGLSKGIVKWSGSIVIDSELTLYYQITEGNYYNTVVSSDAKCNSGVYYECEDLGESLNEAKGYIESFVNLVKINPDNYKENQHDSKI